MTDQPAGVTAASLYPDLAPTAQPDPDKSFDWYGAYCKARYKVADAWIVTSWHAKGELGKPGCFVLVSGGIYPEIMLRGKRKGQTDYRKPVAGSIAEFAITMTDLDVLKSEWETETGECHKCFGSGLEWFGWGVTTGNRFRKCVRCDGTGSAAVSPGEQG